MNIVAFRRRVLEIQAELTALDPTEPGAADRATALGAELDKLAAEQRERTERVAARAFGQTVTPTGVDTPVDTLTALVDRVESVTAPDERGRDHTPPDEDAPNPAPPDHTEEPA